MNDAISLAHGNGGGAMQQLITDLFIAAFDNPHLRSGEDQARLPLTQLMALGDRLAFTTDSYVVDPLFFPGGDIGKLAVCGTINDLAVSGATPHSLSCGFILEEGLPLHLLREVVASMAATAQAAEVTIVTGDTKVVPRGAVDKLFINTSGIGVIPVGLQWGMPQIRADDRLIVSGTLGDHGATILNLREQLGMEGDLRSDCAPLTPLIAPLRNLPGVRALRDATRGGLLAVLHEFAHGSGCGMLIDEGALPLTDAVRGICELLGLNAISFANEGKLLLVVAPESEAQVLQTLHQHPLGQRACTIGRVVVQPGVRLRGLFGVERQLDLPFDEPLPRIC